MRFKSHAILNNIHFQKIIRGYPHLIFYICRYVSTRRLGTAVVKEETCCEWPFARFFFRVNRPNLLLFHVVKVKGKKKNLSFDPNVFLKPKTKSEFLRRPNNLYFGNNDLKTDRNCCKVSALARLSYRKSEL